eukprot:s218_g4.t2
MKSKSLKDVRHVNPDRFYACPLPLADFKLATWMNETFWIPANLETYLAVDHGEQWPEPAKSSGVSKLSCLPSQSSGLSFSPYRSFISSLPGRSEVMRLQKAVEKRHGDRMARAAEAEKELWYEFFHDRSATWLLAPKKTSSQSPVAQVAAAPVPPNVFLRVFGVLLTLVALKIFAGALFRRGAKMGPLPGWMAAVGTVEVVLLVSYTLMFCGRILLQRHASLRLHHAASNALAAAAVQAVVAGLLASRRLARSNLRKMLMTCPSQTPIFEHWPVWWWIFLAGALHSLSLWLSFLSLASLDPVSYTLLWNSQAFLLPLALAPSRRHLTVAAAAAPAAAVAVGYGAGAAAAVGQVVTAAVAEVVMAVAQPAAPIDVLQACQSAQGLLVEVKLQMLPQLLSSEISRDLRGRAMSLEPTFVPGVSSGVLGRPSWSPCPGRGSHGHGQHSWTPWAPWGAAMALPLLRGRRLRRKASFGPTPISEEQKQDIQSTQIGSRVSYVVLSNMQAILRQLDQYGYSQVDGFLGGSANGYPDQIRDEMKSMFDRGWFEEEPESEAQIKGRSGEEKMERLIENQYEVAPTVVNFTRSLLVSFAQPLGELTESGLSNTKGISELFVLCGQGARYDRRVSNVFGWNTEQGFVRDPRKLVAIYFANPNYREEQGGVLQLEGVITPSGAVWHHHAHAARLIWPVALEEVEVLLVILWLCGDPFPAVPYWKSFLESESMPACVTCLCLLQLGKPYLQRKVPSSWFALAPVLSMLAMLALIQGPAASPWYLIQVGFSLTAATLHAVDMAQKQKPQPRLEAVKENRSCTLRRPPTPAPPVAPVKRPPLPPAPRKLSSSNSEVGSTTASNSHSEHGESDSDMPRATAI